MAQFWLQDQDSNILNLDNSVQMISLGGNSRNYKIVDYAGAPGGAIRGFGNPGPKKFKVSRKEKAESGDITAWNSRRNDYLKFFTLSRYKKLWLYVRDGEDTFTVRTEVIVDKIGDDSYKYYRITDNVKSISLISPKGLFENITASTGSQAIPDATEQTVTITNNGIWETPAIFSFTPTGAETLFQVKLTDEYAFRIEGSFTAGSIISYNTADNSLTIGGLDANSAQYITGGSVFNVPPGQDDIYVLCSGAGLFAWSYNERYS